MAVELSTPVVAEATAERTFNEVWLHTFNATATLGKCEIRATIIPCRTLEDGSKELLWDSRQPVHIENLWADGTPDELQLMYGLVQAIKARAGV